MSVSFQLREGRPGVCQSRLTARSIATTCQTTAKPGYGKAVRRLWHTPAADDPVIVRLPQRVRDRIALLSRATYAGFNDHHLCEKLAELEGFSLTRKAPYRRLLRSQGLGLPVNVALPLIASDVCASLAKAN